MRKEKHMMDHHAKRSLRGLVASAIFAAMLGLGGGTASATAFLVDFDPEPFPFGTQESQFTSGGFTFTFTSAGDGGDFAITFSQGDPANPKGVDASSGPTLTGATEIVTIVRTGGGDFNFGSIFIFNSGDPLTIEGFLDFGMPSVTMPFTTTIGAVTMFVNGGDTLVDTILLTSTDIFLIFDSFVGDLPMDMQPVPEPGTLALFVTGLIGLGLLSRRRRRSA